MIISNIKPKKPSNIQKQIINITFQKQSEHHKPTINPTTTSKEHHVPLLLFPHSRDMSLRANVASCFTISRSYKLFVASPLRAEDNGTCWVWGVTGLGFIFNLFFYFKKISMLVIMIWFDAVSCMYEGRQRKPSVKTSRSQLFVQFSEHNVLFDGGNHATRRFVVFQICLGK